MSTSEATHITMMQEKVWNHIGNKRLSSIEKLAKSLGLSGNELFKLLDSRYIKQERKSAADEYNLTSWMLTDMVLEARGVPSKEEDQDAHLKAYLEVSDELRKKRVANGVCPCCNRHFDNLEAHARHAPWIRGGRPCLTI